MNVGFLHIKIRCELAMTDLTDEKSAYFLIWYILYPVDLHRSPFCFFWLPLSPVRKNTVVIKKTGSRSVLRPLSFIRPQDDPCSDPCYLSFRCPFRAFATASPSSAMPAETFQNGRLSALAVSAGSFSSSGSLSPIGSLSSVGAST